MFFMEVLMDRVQRVNNQILYKFIDWQRYYMRFCFEYSFIEGFQIWQGKVVDLIVQVEG